MLSLGGPTFKKNILEIDMNHSVQKDTANSWELGDKKEIERKNVSLFLAIIHSFSLQKDMKLMQDIFKRKLLEHKVYPSRVAQLVAY